MATFTIKRGDTAPQLQISLSIAGTDPRTYWNAGLDKPDGSLRNVARVYFIMRGAANVIVGGTSSKKYTGIAEDPVTLNNKTILAYTWNSGDTNVVGTYNAEFEVHYEGPGGATGKKRTFPSTAGDNLIINVVADLNDE